jgi:hypothetical protein
MEKPERLFTPNSQAAFRRKSRLAGAAKGGTRRFRSQLSGETQTGRRRGYVATPARGFQASTNSPASGR